MQGFYRRHASTLVLVDATYCTTKHLFPLYFLVLKTMLTIKSLLLLFVKKKQQ